MAIILFKTDLLCRSVFLQFLYRNSHRRCSARKGVLRNFAIPTGKHLCSSLLFDKATGLMLATLLKKWLRHRRSPANFAKSLKTPSSQSTSGWLLLSFGSLTSFSSFCAFCVFSFQSNVLNWETKIYVIMLCNFAM